MQFYCNLIILFTGRKFPRTTFWSREFTKSHWRNLLGYLVSGDRKLYTLEWESRNWLRCGPIGGLAKGAHTRDGEEGLVEGSNLEIDDPSGICKQQDNAVGGGADRSDFQRRRAHWRQSRKEAKPAWQLYLFLKKHLSAPLSHIFSCQIYINNNLALTNQVDKNLALGFMGSFLAEKSIHEIYDIIINAETCYFNAPFGDVQRHYYDYYQSKDIIHELLKFQFDNNMKKIKQFVLDLYHVTDRIIPKKNAFMVISPPNGGKNYFFDAVTHFFFSCRNDRKFFKTSKLSITGMSE